MRFTSKLMTGAGVLALSTGFAAAAPALVQNDLNLRAGPGVEFPVVAAMPAGTTVNVMGCQASWCQVAFGGTAGWANRAFLGLGGGAVAGAVAVAPRYGTYESYGYGGYAPAYGYDEGTYVSGGYGPGYTYGSYGTPAYGTTYGYYEGNRTFGNERRFDEQVAVRGERSTSVNVRGERSANVNVRGERLADVNFRGERSGNVNVRGERSANVNVRGSADANVRAERGNARAGVSGSARAETQTAPEIKGNNPMKPEKTSAPAANSQAPSEIQGNNPMKVGSGAAAANEQRGSAQAGAKRGNARATTGAALRENR